MQGELYPFGYGRSYTTFEYSGLEVSPKKQHTQGIYTVKCKVTNTGKYAGDEVVQLYVRRPGAKVEWPHKVLKAFQRATLDAGITQTITLEVPVAELRHWDEATNGWKLESGTIEVLVGGSSATLPLKATITI